MVPGGSSRRELPGYLPLDVWYAMYLHSVALQGSCTNLQKRVGSRGETVQSMMQSAKAFYQANQVDW